MIVFTCRSGQVIHLSQSCPLIRGPVFDVDDTDTLPNATTCATCSGVARNP